MSAASWPSSACAIAPRPWSPPTNRAWSCPGRITADGRAGLGAFPLALEMLACAGPIVVILAAMEITGLGWCGTRTGRSSELAHFYEDVLRLRPGPTGGGFWVFSVPGG